MEPFAKLANEYLNCLFTHIHASCGLLNQEKPKFVFEHLPQGRDVFDLASLTKALVTTPLIFREAVENRIDLKAPFGSWKELRHFRKLDQRLLDLTPFEVLSHQSGLPAWRNFYVCRLGASTECPCQNRDSAEQRIEIVLNRCAESLSKEKSFVYSDVGFILLGYLLAQMKKQPLNAIYSEFSKIIFRGEKPMGPLGFASDLHDLAKMAIGTGFCQVRQRELIGEVHDENCAAFGGIAGHAGIFGTGLALLDYLRQLLQSRIGQVMFEENAKLVTTAKDTGLLGWRLGSDAGSRTFGGGKALGHLGFTGTAYYISYDRLKYSILLTNRVISGRISPQIQPFRAQAFAILNQYLQ